MIDKGKISAIKGDMAEVIPSQSSAAVTTTLKISDLLKGNLSVNTEVVYVMFEDNTGLIFERLDGKHTHKHKYTHAGLSSGEDTTGVPVE